MSLILSKKIYDIKEIPKKTGIYFFLDINGIQFISEKVETR